MTDPKEVSSFSMERKECEKCGAVWLNGQHMWTGTGQKGNELDLDSFATTFQEKIPITTNVLMLVVVK